MVQKSTNDTTDNPENYRVPVESGDPANLFVNVNNENPKDENSQKNSATETNKVQNNVSDQQVVKENKTNEPVTNNEKQNPVIKSENNIKEQPVVAPDASSKLTQNNNNEKPVIISENNLKEQTITSNESIKFKVQVGACHRKISYQELHQRYKGGKEIATEFHESWYKYLIGNFSKYTEAKQEKLSCGTPDAWVVAYKGKNRVPISEVLNMLSYYPMNKLMLIMLS
jgi:hypothetical protein